MDQLDKTLLQELQKNCKISIKELAKKLNLPISTVFTRVKNLEKRGVIKEYKAILDYDKVEKSTLAFVLLSYEPNKKVSQESLARKISLIPNVQEVHIIAGEWDILIKVRGKNIEEISDIVLNKIREIAGVEKTYSLIVFKSVKESTEIQL